ncbi:MAG TPA: SIMPL domain-containing protein [Thermoguttaceae bacterium]|nr:SIMPL domain-containing protein [Thermoguttaceae bacterium]
MTRSMKKICLVFLGLCALILTTIVASNIARAEGTITGHGSAPLNVKPTKALVFVQLTGQGKTLSAALDDLNGRYKNLAAKLETLKAEKDSIHLATPNPAAGPIGPFTAPASTSWSSGSVTISRGPVTYSVPAPRISSTMSAPSLVVDPAMSYQPPMAGPSANVRYASAALTAQWTLPDADPQKVLVFVDDLKAKVKSAAMPDSKKSEKSEEKLSPQEQEILEEMQASSPAYGGSATPGMISTGVVVEPVIVYVGQIPPEARREALQKAFKQARNNATELAQAAHVRLGPLATLHEGGSRFQVESPEQQLFRTQLVALQSLRASGKLRPEEVFCPSPDELTQRIEISAAFTIKE